MVSVFVILVSMCPISAFAAPDSYYYFPYSRPTVTPYSGYVELLFEDVSSGYTFVDVISWFFTPYVDTSVSTFVPSDRPEVRFVRNESQFRLGLTTQPGVSGNVSYVRVDTMGNHNFGYMDIPDDDGIRYFNFNWGSNFELIGVHYYGDFTSFDNTDTFVNEEFYVTYGDESVFAYGLNQVISALYSLIDITDSDAYKTQLDTIISNLNSFEGSFDEFVSYYKTQMTDILRLTNLILDKLDTLIDQTDDVEGFLEAISVTLSQLEMYMFDVWLEQFTHTSELQAVNQKLQTIIEILQSKGESDLTQPDTSNLDGYYDIENSLLDDSNIDPSQVLNIELNQNALSAIWNLVDRVLNVNPKVFGAVIIILALGILALILGR